MCFCWLAHFMSLSFPLCPALPPAGGRRSERADVRLSRQHSQQSLALSHTQSVGSLTSDLWDRSSADTPGIFAHVVSRADTQQQRNGDSHSHTLACLCPPRVSNPQMKLTHRFLTGSVV